MPSFVVTLAGLLICAGRDHQDLLGTQGVIGIQDHQINDIANYVLTKNTGWIVAIVFTVLLAAAAFGTYFSRRRAGLPTGNLLADRRPRRLLRRAHVRRRRDLQPLRAASRSSG